MPVWKQITDRDEVVAGLGREPRTAIQTHGSTIDRNPLRSGRSLASQRSPIVSAATESHRG